MSNTSNIKYQKKYLFGFMDETGLLKTPDTDKIFALGMLKLHHPSLIHRAIVSYKNKRNYYQEFKFSNISSQNVLLYKGFIDLFFKVYGCKFSALVFDKTNLNIDHFFNSDYDHAYNAFVSKLVSESLDQGEYIVVLADDVSTPKSDNFEKDVKSKVKNNSKRNALFGIARLESHAVSEIQMTDVILGIVGYSFKLKHNLIPKPSKSKLEILKHFKKKLKKQNITEPFTKKLKGGGSFSVFEFEPKKK